jgi:antirestriction protein ArdC
MKIERFDVYQHITDKIVSAIERGAGEFRRPWHRAAGSIRRPVNVASKKAYRGVNVVALCAYAEEFGYSSGTWGSYKQWSAAGAQVRKGEKAAFVVFYKEFEVAADPETGDAETATRLFARATPVFAAEQVDGFARDGRSAAGDDHPADRASGGFRCRDRRIHPSWRRPSLLSPLDR